MQGDIVTAAQWLGASLLLSSGVLIGGLRWVRTEESRRPDGAPASHSGRPAPAGVAPDVLVGSSRTPEPDAAVLRARVEERTRKIPVLGQGINDNMIDLIRRGPPTGVCFDPPSEEEIWAKVPGSADHSNDPSKTGRESARFLIEKIGEKVDPGKMYPLAGLCQLIHCHYKCTIYFNKSYSPDHPIPFSHIEQRVEVVYLDKDYLRRSEVATAR